MKRLLIVISFFIVYFSYASDDIENQVAISSNTYPTSVLTPGKADPRLTKEVICSKYFRTGKYRNVSEEEKKKVFEEYKIPWSSRSGYEVDHFISLELGGSNDITNLWPESYRPIPGAHEKDKVENYLHKEVCQGKISLEDAQKAITADWVSIYRGIK